MTIVLISLILFVVATWTIVFYAITSWLMERSRLVPSDDEDQDDDDDGGLLRGPDVPPIDWDSWSREFDRDLVR